MAQPLWAQDRAKPVSDPAFPRTAPPPAAGIAGSGIGEAPAEEQDASQIVVTGTSIRGISAVGSAAVSVTREQLATSGRSDPVAVLRELPQVQGLGFDETPKTGQNGGGNIQRGSTVNLRGLGSNATLLLIDGHRIAPTGNVFSFTEANQLPVSAIERIEVIADGASAIYGSDAVAGVVNYITRKRFRGVEASVRGTTSDGYNGWGASLITGMNWGSGGFAAAYDHDDRGEFRSGQSPYLRQDLRPFGGADNRIRTNTATAFNPGNLVVPRATNNPTLPTAGRFDYYGLPQGTNGLGLTGANLLLNQPNLDDTSNYTSFLPHTVRNQVSVNAEQEFASWLKLTFLGFYNRRDSTQHSLAQSGVRTIPSTVPYYITGVPGIAPGAPETVDFSLLRDIGTSVTNIYDVTYQGALTLTADLLAGWRGEAGVNLSRDRNCANCIPALNNNIDTIALQAALNNGTYNPFSQVQADKSVLATFLPSAFDRNRSTVDQYTVRFDGPLVQLPGGELKAAVGGEYLRLTQWRSAIGVKATSDVPLAVANRNIKAAYAELFIPLLGGDFTLPLVQRLAIDAAIRTETYSDAGSTTNPKVGVTWDVTDGVSLRGAWGTSFRAPNLIENNPAFFSRVSLTTLSNLSGDPAIGLTNSATNQTNVLNVAGSNADLVPETATNYSFGIDLEPRFIPGLRVNATYYNIHYQNAIIGLQGFLAGYLASATNRQLYAPYIVPAIQPSTCVNGQRATYNPAYLPALGRPSVAVIDESNLCSARAVVYTQNSNASDVRQDGIDVMAEYRFSAGPHQFAISGSFSKILGNDTQIVAGGAVIDGRDIINYPVSMRGRGSVNWRYEALSITPSFNYIGPYTNNLPISVNGIALPVARIPSWTTFDLNVVLDVGKLATWGRDLTVALNVRNITGKNPPVVLSANGNAFDTQNANPFGTIANLQVTKRF
ncbi:MAG: TonB-dependent receptor [Croceibacterium sp.]